ncbi:MAG: iron transporter FeoB, partial [Melioribacteraceae bacterium]
HKIEIDVRSLSRELGIPVIATSARQGEGIPELLKMINEVATGKFVCKPHRITAGSKKLKKSVEELSQKITELYPELPNSRWVALRLLEGDQRIIDAVKNGELGTLRKQNTVAELENV